MATASCFGILPSKLIIACFAYAKSSQTSLVCKLFALLDQPNNLVTFSGWNKLIFLRNLIPYSLAAALPFYEEASKFNLHINDDFRIRLQVLQKSEDKMSAWLYKRRWQLAAVREAEFDHPMRLMPSEIEHLCGLKRLRVSTGLVKLNLNFGSLIHLTKLFLSNNALSDLPASFSALREIIALRLDYNAFKEVPLVLCSLRKLQYFSLRFNQIKRFPVESKNWQDLRYIDFSNNECTELPEPLFYCVRLSHIIAKYNHIHSYDPMAYPAAKLIDLEGNPLEAFSNVTLPGQECLETLSHVVDGNSRYAKVAKWHRTE